MIKAVIYARVSSKEQEREGFSIPAQLKLLKEYALKNNFVITKEYTDAETAKRVGRTAFKCMLEDIKSNKINVLIVEKTDRLTRNFRDFVAIDDLIHEVGLEVHLVKENEVMGPKAKSHAKMVHGIKVVLAKNYIDNLSEEIQKGLHEKASQGWYPHQPPYGYKGHKGKVIIAEDKACFVKRLYELYASGNYSMERIPQQMLSEGYAYLPSKERVPLRTVENILKSPFYRGRFQYGGNIYEGKHELFIPHNLFGQIDKVMQQKGHKETDRNFLYQGLMTCANCGCAVVGQIQKERYIYYHCTNAKKVCKRVYVREEIITAEVMAVLESIKPNAEQCEWLKLIMKSSLQDKEIYFEDTKTRLEKNIDRIDKQLGQLYDDYVEGLIDKAMYLNKREYLTERKQDQMSQLENHHKASGAYYDKGVLIVELAKNAAGLYESLSKDQKRDLLKIVQSNFLMREGKPLLELSFVFSSMAQIAEKRDVVETVGVEPTSKTYVIQFLRA